MRRRHTREDYLGLVDRIRDAIPEVTLSTDMIVGFPGEDRDDFQDTLSLVEAVGYHSMYSFKYSARPSTLASKRLPDDVPETEKTRRIVMLQDRQRKIQSRLFARMTGSEVEVLVDSLSRRRATELSGRTTGNTVVNFPVPLTSQSSKEPPSSWIGQTVCVRIKRTGAHSLWGEVVENHSEAKPC
jgi:tRNA-2-methylthio-N6-dimethylallyladenosine synthase